MVFKWIFPSIYILVVGPFFVEATPKIALFPSTGCFSHDVMMKQVGQQLDVNGSDITWVQIYLYEFGFGEIPIPDKWKRISIAGIDKRGEYLQQNTGQLIWKQNVPFDFAKPFNIQGIADFILMLQRHQEYCTLMLEDPRFQKLRSSNITVAVLDHFLLECMGGLSHLLNASVVQFSNWPIADGYVTSLNLPANPSSIAKTGTPSSSYSMTFLERCKNVLFHIAIVVTRFVQMRTLDRMFAERNYPEIQVEKNEAKQPIYAGRSEMLFDTIRPINNRIKYFGAASTPPPINYISSLPFNSTPTIHHTNPPREITKVLETSLTGGASLGGWNVTNCMGCEGNIKEKKVVEAHHLRRPWLFQTNTVSTNTILNRQILLREKYTTINWDAVHAEKFVLVTFGSVAQVDKMHTSLMKSLLSTFSKQPGIIIWQSNLDKDQIQKIHNVTVPDNVMLSSWVPIKELLAHQNIEFIICHGGINTVNELGLFGVPVLGVPLQGDQASNLARIVDMGGAELMTIVELNEGKLDSMMAKMRNNLGKYWSRSEKLALMLSHHRSLHQERGYQQFWLNWVARNGKKLENRKLFRMEYVGNQEHQLHFVIFTFLIGIIGFLSC